MHGDGGDEDSNFMQLMNMHARNDPHLALWLQEKTDKYLSHDIRNELLKVMALSVLHDVSCAHISTQSCVMNAPMPQTRSN